MINKKKTGSETLAAYEEHLNQVNSWQKIKYGLILYPCSLSIIVGYNEKNVYWMLILRNLEVSWRKTGKEYWVPQKVPQRQRGKR